MKDERWWWWTCDGRTLLTTADGKQTDKRRWTDVARLPTHNLPDKADRQYRPCTAAASSATMSRGVTKYSRSTIFGVTATAAVCCFERMAVCQHHRRSWELRCMQLAITALCHCIAYTLLRLGWWWTCYNVLRRWQLIVVTFVYYEVDKTQHVGLLAR